MRKLLPVPMMGQGTADVESLASYVLRCAHTHAVSSRVLISWVFGNAELDDLPTVNSVFGGRYLEVLARPNLYSESVRTALATVSGQDLRCRPIEFLTAQVSGLSKDIGGIRWCPECLQEMEELELPMYIKQLWHMRVITHCPIHRLPLIEECPFCGAGQGRKEAEVPVGICPACHESIASRSSTVKPKEIRTSWHCPENDLWDLFSQSSSANVNISFEGFSGSMKSLRQQFPRLCKADKACLREYFRKPDNNNLTLLSYRRLAHWCGVSLFDFLSGRAPKYKPLFFMGAFFKLPAELERTKKPYRNHEEIYNKLIGFVHEENPASLKQVANYLGVSVGYIENRYASIAALIVKRKKDYIKSLREKNIENAMSSAFYYFVEGKFSGEVRSRKSAYKKIKEETNLPKHIIRKSVRNAYNSVYGIRK